MLLLVEAFSCPKGEQMFTVRPNNEIGSPQGFKLLLDVCAGKLQGSE
jgi:hypothetical protein